MTIEKTSEKILDQDQPMIKLTIIGEAMAVLFC